MNKAIWWPGGVGAIIKITLGLFGIQLTLDYDLLKLHIINQLSVCTGAWAYAMVYPDGSVRNGAGDILNLMTLSYNPTVRPLLAHSLRPP